MKCLLILVGLTLYMSCTDAQSTCVGRPINQVCTGNQDEGNSNTRWCGVTAMNEMWYWSSRTRKCEKMRYRGCGGNNNRYCSNRDCTLKCRR
ncbi:hypothetical protein M5D96_005361 [Drosophila gunungcola]|uniref:BPTI/Kunitz inhibitor domain-containing protein n=1 Tax=Drosophila gunungcola TaxID=103775 RepID=A0A9P9YQ66_9MUSC|nr:hypothetical protein M5D96_005361 [Drosophila gunungcola]